jgi:hypothetical protein
VSLEMLRADRRRSYDDQAEYALGGAYLLLELDLDQFNVGVSRTLERLACDVFLEALVFGCSRSANCSSPTQRQGSVRFGAQGDRIMMLSADTEAWTSYSRIEWTGE